MLHYQKEEEYQEHYDIYFDSVNIINGGQRVATVLLYLSDVEEGEMSLMAASPPGMILLEQETLRQDCM